MRSCCPHCSRPVRQVRNTTGPNYCPHCQRLFFIPATRHLPPWLLGVVTVLLGHMQLMWRISSAGW